MEFVFCFVLRKHSDQKREKKVTYLQTFFFKVCCLHCGCSPRIKVVFVFSNVHADINKPWGGLIQVLQQWDCIFLWMAGRYLRG